MKKIILLFAIIGIQTSYAQLSVEKTEKYLYSADSIQCVAYNDLLSLFNTWEKDVYKNALKRIEISSEMYKILKKSGTYKDASKQENFEKLMAANAKVCKANIDYFGSTFVSLMKSSAPKQNFEYAGVTYYITKYNKDYFLSITKDIQTYCK